MRMSTKMVFICLIENPTSIFLTVDKIVGWVLNVWKFCGCVDMWWVAAGWVFDGWMTVWYFFLLEASIVVNPPLSSHLSLRARGLFIILYTPEI